jgi:hypothetical protein
MFGLLFSFVANSSVRIILSVRPECNPALEYMNAPPEPQILSDVPAALPEQWPREGAISFEDYYLTYRPGLEPALKVCGACRDGSWR